MHRGSNRARNHSRWCANDNGACCHHTLWTYGLALLALPKHLLTKAALQRCPLRGHTSRFQVAHPSASTSVGRPSRHRNVFLKCFSLPRFLSRNCQTCGPMAARFGSFVTEISPPEGLEKNRCCSRMRLWSGPAMVGNSRFCQPPIFVEEFLMNIEIHDAVLEARIRRQIEATGAGSVEEALLRLLETQEEQDRWLLESREAINSKIRRGIEQLDRGEGIPEDQLDAYLDNLKSQPE